MPVVNGSLAGKAYDMRFSDLAAPLSASLMTEGIFCGISLGEASSISGDSSTGLRPLIVGLSKDTTEGSPLSPCIKLQNPETFWRFRWVVKPGQRRIALHVKQDDAFAIQRPTIIVRKNDTVGLTTDYTMTSPGGSDWTIIGPGIFNFTGN